MQNGYAAAFIFAVPKMLDINFDKTKWKVLVKSNFPLTFIIPQYAKFLFLLQLPQVGVKLYLPGVPEIFRAERICFNSLNLMRLMPTQGEQI